MKKANAAAENLSMYDNYFELLNLEKKFDINKDRLHQNYIRLQQILHPDKQFNKTNSEKFLAMEYTAKLNKAYQILNDDKKRAEYLLSLEGIIINKEENNNVHLDPIILNEILEINEEPEKYDISLIKQECWDSFINHYASNNFKAAAQEIIKLQYLNKL